MNLTTTVEGYDVTFRRLEGPDPTLVLIHGAGRNHMAWDEVLPKIGGVDLVIPSLPGRCGSEGTPPSSIADAAAWLRMFLRRCGLTRVVVAGHSFGGAVALEYALSEPPAESRRGPELAGLVMVCSGARLRVKDEIMKALEEAASAGIHYDAARLYRPDSDPAIVRREEAAAAHTPPDVGLVDWQAANAFDRMEDLSGVKVPTLVVGGEDDELTPPKYARYLADNIEGAELTLLESAGHMLPFERHDTLAVALHDFVKAL